MQRPRHPGAALASGLAALLGSTALVVPAAALAQTDAPVSGSAPAASPETAPAPAPQGQVQRIIVKGNERIEASTVVSYLPIQPGDMIDSSRIDQGLKALFRTDLFSDVKIDFTDGDLVVTVVEN